MPPSTIAAPYGVQAIGSGGAGRLQNQAGGKGAARQEDETFAPLGGRHRARRLVLEPGAHARLRDGFSDAGGGELRRVVLDLQALTDDVGVERLEAGQLRQAPLEDGDLFVTVHPLDLEDRFRVQLADGAGGGRHGCSST